MALRADMQRERLQAEKVAAVCSSEVKEQEGVWLSGQEFSGETQQYAETDYRHASDTPGQY